MGGMPQVWFRGSAAEELSMSVVIHMRKYTDVTIAGRRVATALCCRDALLPSTADSTNIRGAIVAALAWQRILMGILISEPNIAPQNHI